MNEDRPGYYGILPAAVRYCPTLCFGAMVMYSEFSALCNKEGYCWASNSYFANLYNLNSGTISEWVSSLKNAGLIIVEIFPEKGNLRRISLLEIPKRSSEKTVEGYTEKTDANNTTSINTKKKKSASPKCSLQSNAEIPSELNTSAFLIAWDSWMKYRKQAKKTLTESTQEKQLATLAEMGIRDAIKSIDQSIEKGWTGLFKPKEEKNSAQSNAPQSDHGTIWKRAEAQDIIRAFRSNPASANIPHCKMLFNKCVDEASSRDEVVAYLATLITSTQLQEITS